MITTQHLITLRTVIIWGYNKLGGLEEFANITIWAGGGRDGYNNLGWLEMGWKTVNCGVDNKMGGVENHVLLITYLCVC